MTKRVVVTGMAGLSPMGLSWPEVESSLRNGKNSIIYMPEWEKFAGLNTRLAAPLPPFDLPPNYSRKRTRSMGRVSLLATRASELALMDAGLIDDPLLKSGRVGVAYGSSSGSPPAIYDMARMMLNESTDTVKANTYIQMMPHTAAVNVSVFFGTCGLLIPTSSACTSGSMAVGAAFEAIRQGKQTAMIAGGAEELSVTQAAVFDSLFVTSTLNERPESTPRPFDVDRDGMVVGEGAATLILEDLDHAQARGAKIIAEVAGFATNSDGKHVTQPAAEMMTVAMQQALTDAALPPEAIDYVSAHGTATDIGDVAESQATRMALRRPVPISSLKSYIGHSLGACGSIEAWVVLEMLNRDWYAPTINLTHIDPDCAELDYIVGEGSEMVCEYVMTNNFAFGGVNTSLIFRRWK